jgi:hypothetical protein
MHCYHCQHEVNVQDRIGRGETCPQCAANLHCCRNCLFYDLGAANACQEPQVDPVVDKERANFCEFFTPGRQQPHRTSTTTEARAKLEALFKKK